MKTGTTATIAVMGLAALMGLTQCGKSKKNDTSRSADSAVVSVVISEIKERSYEDWGSYSADLRGIEDANLTAPYQGGRVNSIKEIGVSAKKGDPLCDIDGDKYEAALQASNAQVEVAQGELERAKVNVQNGSVGRAALDGANLAYQNARMLQASAKRAYEDCKCQAPFDGILVSRAIERYQTVAPGMTTVRIARTNRLEAVIAIPETEAFGYAEGMKTVFHLLQAPEQFYTGHLENLDRAVDSRSRLVTARIVIENPRGTLKPGMVGRARILRKTYAKAIVVPATALLRLENGISVMIAEDGVARQHPVKVESMGQDSALISSGLVQGDKLITTGAFQVSDGTKLAF